MLNHLLLYRIIIVNAVGAVLLAYAWQKGWVTTLFDGDSTGLCYAMTGLFLIFLVSLSIRATKVSGLLNRSKKAGFTPRYVNKAKFMAKQTHLGAIPNWIALLGLIGTVVGIAMALLAVDPEAMASTDGMRTAIGGLIEGIQIALYTTIVGSVLGLWASINWQILRTATVSALEDVRGGIA